MQPLDRTFADVLATIEDIEVSAYTRGTTNAVTIFQRPMGAMAQGPTPESGASGGKNPFITGQSGNVEFWVDSPAEVDVVIHDTHAPSRIVDRAFGWNAIAVGAGSLPTSVLKTDGSLALGKLGAGCRPAVVTYWYSDRLVASACLRDSPKRFGRFVTDARSRLAVTISVSLVLSTCLTYATRSSSVPIRVRRRAQVPIRAMPLPMRLVLPALAVAMLARTSPTVTVSPVSTTRITTQRRITTTRSMRARPIPAITATGLAWVRPTVRTVHAFGGGEPFSFANHAHSAWTDAPGQPWHRWLARPVRYTPLPLGVVVPMSASTVLPTRQHGPPIRAAICVPGSSVCSS